MKNPKFYQLALAAGGAHYPEVGGVLLEQFAEALVRQCADIALTEDHDPSDCILQFYGLSRNDRRIEP
jgi:hypothetical protein